MLARERRDRLLRFLVAGALGMQVMTLAVALYAGAFSGMEEPFRKFFRWTSLLLTAPVLLYSARPFFAGAFKDLSHARVGMDVPVALGLTLAYFGSVWATLADRGEVYFDSVVMFVFLLLGARVLELVARERAVREQESVVRTVPATARRQARTATAARAIVATVELAVGDRVRILPGESVPADGVIEDGLSSLDEALLTGESVPVARAAGERVIGGAVNVESPLVVRVTAVGEGTVLQALLGLVEQALAAKPEISRVADRTAQWFVRRILLLATGVGLYWAWADPERVLPTVIAVLVVSCPCALSLATPVALAAASGALARRGLLATRGHAIETLGRADLFVFDKTGTLTTGKLRVDAVEPQAPWSAAEVLGDRRGARARLRASHRQRDRRRERRRRMGGERRLGRDLARDLRDLAQCPRPRSDGDGGRRARWRSARRASSPSSWVSPCRRRSPRSPPANGRWSSSPASRGCAGRSCSTTRCAPRAPPWSPSCAARASACCSSRATSPGRCAGSPPPPASTSGRGAPPPSARWRGCASSRRPARWSR